MYRGISIVPRWKEGRDWTERARSSVPRPTVEPNEIANAGAVDTMFLDAESCAFFSLSMYVHDRSAVSRSDLWLILDGLVGGRFT
mmetsp:Transcript_6133/g.9326  ORF Transcript_6133/g.9326 Transcript_6133/m.9326 type:complete len:85 (-) Transcript_6133:1224-1478(-)